MTLRNLLPTLSLPLLPISISLLFGLGGLDRAQAQGFAVQWGSAGAAPGQFNHPAGLGVDAAGNVYVADTSNHRVQKFDANGNLLSVIDAASSGATISFPSDVAVSGSGILYIADGSQVTVIDAGGALLGSWPNAASGGITFQGLFGIALGPDGSVYTTEIGNGGIAAPVRVRRFAADGGLLNEWGSRGSGPGQFEKLLYLTVDAAGDVYVVDNGNGRIEKFSAAGLYEATIGSFASSSVEDACGKFHDVHGVAVDADGHVFASDNAIRPRVHLLMPDGACVVFWGAYGSGPAQFSAIADVAIGEGGALYVSDTGNSRIQKFTSPSVPAASTSWGLLKVLYRR